MGQKKGPILAIFYAQNGQKKIIILLEKVNQK